jgi:Arc/MetJ-type ribon-helix-helix transcriptional regulator
MATAPEVCYQKIWSGILALGSSHRQGQTMNITLSPDQTTFIRRAIDAGRFDRPEDAVTEALMLWEDREHRRADLFGSLDEADASLDRGEGMDITRESMHGLAEDIKRRGRARLTAERHAAP